MPETLPPDHNPPALQQNPLNKRLKSLIPLFVVIIIVAFVSGMMGYTIGKQDSGATRVQPNVTLARKNIQTPTSSPKVHEICLGNCISPTAITTHPVNGYVTPTPDPSMTNWKTYTDPSGISLQYPTEWSLQTNISPDYNSVQIDFAIPPLNPDKEALSVELYIGKNDLANNSLPANATLSQWYQSQAYPGDGNLKQVVIDGYPALVTSANGALNLRKYVVIAPGFDENNAEYLFVFANPQSGEGNVTQNMYSPTDPYVIGQVANFDKVVASVRF